MYCYRADNLQENILLYLFLSTLVYQALIVGDMSRWFVFSIAISSQCYLLESLQTRYTSILVCYMTNRTSAVHQLRDCRLLHY